MTWLFGKKPKPVPVETPAQRTEKVNEQIEILEKKMNFMGGEIQKLRQQALDWAKKGQKDRARAILVKAKTMEQQRARLVGVIQNMEHQVDAIHNAEVNSEIFHLFVKNAELLEDLASKVDPDKAEEIIEKLEEAYDKISEVSDILARPIGLPPGIDDDVDEELAQLMKTGEGNLPAGEGNLPADVGAIVGPSQHDAALDQLMAQFA